VLRGQLLPSEHRKNIMNKYYEKKVYNGIEMYQCRYEKEWSVLTKIAVATIITLGLLLAGTMDYQLITQGL